MKKQQTLRSESSLDIVITGGGTGGHVYPGIAVAKELRRQIPSASILFIGTQTGLEAKIVPHEGFALETIDIQGFKSKGTLRKLKTLYKLPYAVYRARKFLRGFRPHAVFGTGGYVSVPVIYASYLLHIPTLILEPNRQPGLANKLLSKSVDRIAICFQETATAFPKEKIIFTGNPVRREFSLIGKTPPPDKGSKHNILIIGGSLGAKSINYAVIEALDSLTDQRERLVFTHQTGPNDYTYVKTNYEKKCFRADVLEYITDIPKMYAKSHLIICRAGASTVAELKASRRPAILIPYPHGDRHQEFNALALKEEGFAKVILQANLSGKSLAKAISHSLQHPETFAQVWFNIREVEKKTAAEQVVDICLQLARGKINSI
jgi:UDP-N-acetylglucosamine--N-acetylmuramyl-(pentapeptide) pyrophosphoryl-undecaprenol N-acetylglucosamine transferase